MKDILISINMIQRWHCL